MSEAAAGPGRLEPPFQPHQPVSLVQPASHSCSPGVLPFLKIHSQPSGPLGPGEEADLCTGHSLEMSSEAGQS